MPYSAEHKAETRQKILDSALRLFSLEGYDAVSIDLVMADVGLTRGGFYAHFISKGELYTEAMLSGARNSQVRDRLKQADRTSVFRDLITGYLREQHLQMQQSPCPLAFLVSDVASKDQEVRKTYTRIYKGLVTAIGGLLTSSEPDEVGARARAVVALMIGGVALGRAIDDSKESKKLLDACQLLALEQAE